MTSFLSVIGILLRFIDLGTPDIATDEAQFALGKSAAHPPLGIALLRLAQMIGGENLIALRMPSVVIGCLSLWLIYRIALLWVEKDQARLAVFAAALFPAHILFSRLAYLDVQLFILWLLSLLAFERARRERSSQNLLFVFIACTAVGFIKMQGFAFPFLLLLGLTLERRQKIWRDPLAVILVLSLLPALFYIVSRPGIFATVVANSGAASDIASPLSRIADMTERWWHVLWLMLPASILSLPFLRRFGWPVWALLGFACVQQYVLGATHDYYITTFTILALPIGSALSSLPSKLRTTVCLVLTCNAFVLLAPMSLRTPYTNVHPLDREQYWNTHAEAINSALEGTEKVIAMGYIGHHVRWYLEPEVLVGKDMDTHSMIGTFVYLNGQKPEARDGEIVYEDEFLTIVRRDRLRLGS